MAKLSILLLAAMLTVAPACGDDAGPDPMPRPGAALRGKITVFAAASLTDAFHEIATEFKKQNVGTDVEFNFGGSPTLRTQLEQGARADVFASADLNQMDLARQSGVVGAGAKVFARNALVIIVPKSNPGKISAPSDLKRGGLKLVFANPDVPAGNYARQSLLAMERDAAHGAGFADAVLKNVVSLESNVKQVVAKVELGEADAGIVYGTDVTASVAPKLRTVEIPPRFNVTAEYPIALTKTPANPPVGRAFIEFVLSSDAQTVLKKYGFLTVS